jgi:hypothetical protein
LIKKFSEWPVSSLVSFKVLPSGTHTLVPVLLSLLETFLEVFFRNNPQTVCHVGNDVFSYVKSLPFHHFFEYEEQPEVIYWQVRRISWLWLHGNVFTLKNLADREWCMAGHVVMMEHPTIPPILQSFPLDGLSQILQNFFVRCWINCLTSGNKFRMKVPSIKMAVFWDVAPCSHFLRSKYS